MERVRLARVVPEPDRDEPDRDDDRAVFAALPAARPVPDDARLEGEVPDDARLDRDAPVRVPPFAARAARRSAAGTSSVTTAAAVSTASGSAVCRVDSGQTPSGRPA